MKLCKAQYNKLFLSLIWIPMDNEQQLPLIEWFQHKQKKTGRNSIKTS